MNSRQLLGAVLALLLLGGFARAQDGKDRLRLQKVAEKNPTVENYRSLDRSLLLALAVLERVRQENLDQEADKMQIVGESFDLFVARIKVLNKLFELEKKPKHLEDAFSTAEQATARAFLESLGKARQKLSADEKKLLDEIRKLDQKLDKNVGLKYPRPAKLEDARASLRAEEVALFFMPGKDGSILMLMDAKPKADDKANGLEVLDLPGSKALAEKVSALTDPDTLAKPARVKALGRELHKMLLGPCQERIKGKNLVIIPNESLCFLPFELLVDKDGKYLVEKHRIRYAPSLTALHFIRLWDQKRVAPTMPLFAVGDPLYGAGESKWREGQAGAFKRLTHSGAEVAAIAKILDARPEYVLTRGDASVAKLKQASDAGTLAKARYVHFATHGILGIDVGKQPALVLSPVGKDVEAGFLQMEDITTLKLNADLVVLSASRTGLGRMHRGEGVTGLARAFLYAGSKAVMCSLWSVDDCETANLMIDFYGHLHKGKSAPEALREAQLAMIRAGKAPLFWAPFIVIAE